MTLEIFLMALLLGVPAYYVLDALLLEKKYDHEGPFPSETRFVEFPEIETMHGLDKYFEAGHTQRVCLWDWVRRLDGVYKVEGNVWTVNVKRAERWTCPFCLSFWTTIPFTIFFCVTSGLWVWIVPIHLGIAVASQLVYRVSNAGE